MRIFGKGKAIARIVVARIGKLVDVSSIDDAAARNCGKTVLSQGARIVVSRDNVQAEARFASLFLGLFRPIVRSNFVLLNRMNMEIQL